MPQTPGAARCFTWNTKKTRVPPGGPDHAMNEHIDLDWLFDRCSPVPVSGCWLWTLSTKGSGYAQVGYGKRRSVSAHILAYQFKYGPVPKGLELDHLCRVPCCINPDHLEPVKHRENMLRGALPAMARKLATAFHEEKRRQAGAGAPLEPDQVAEGRGAAGPHHARRRH